MNPGELGIIIIQSEQSAGTIDRNTPHGKAQLAFNEAVDLSNLNNGTQIDVEVQGEEIIFHFAERTGVNTIGNQPVPLNDKERRKFIHAANNMPVVDKDALPAEVDEYRRALTVLGLSGEQRRKRVGIFEEKVFDGNHKVTRGALDDAKRLKEGVILFQEKRLARRAS